MQQNNRSDAVFLIAKTGNILPCVNLGRINGLWDQKKIYSLFMPSVASKLATEQALGSFLQGNVQGSGGKPSLLMATLDTVLDRSETSVPLVLNLTLSHRHPIVPPDHDMDSYAGGQGSNHSRVFSPKLVEKVLWLQNLVFSKLQVQSAQCLSSVMMCDHGQRSYVCLLTSPPYLVP